MTTPHGEYERRHATRLRQGDHVWDDDMRRWRRVTSAFTYVCSRSGQEMVKFVLDISTWHRVSASDTDATYAVLTGTLPDTFAPRTRSRRSSRSDDEPANTPATTSEPPIQSSARPSDTTTSGDDIRARRDALKLSRKAFAELAGVTPGALWRIEQGRGTPEENDKVTTTLSGLER